MDRADRHDRRRRIDRHAAAVKVVEPDNAVDVRVFRQQFGLDPLDDVIDDAGDALHGRRDRQHVLGADGAIRIAVALEAVALQRRQGHRHLVRQRQRRQRRGFGQPHQRFFDPGTTRDRLLRIANDFAIAKDRGILSQVGERDLVPLRHVLAQRQAVVKDRAGRQSARIDDDRHVVGCMHLDVERLTGFHGGIPKCGFRAFLAPSRARVGETSGRAPQAPSRRACSSAPRSCR